MTRQRFFLLGIAILVGLLVWLSGPPEGVELKAWTLLSVFLFTIVGIILKAMPMGAMGLFGMTILALSGTLTFEEVFSGFHNKVVWLIVIAFFIARGFIKTGLGKRIAYQLMFYLGKSTKGLAYGMVFTDFILAPAIPSITARAGGILYPVVISLAKAFGSEPNSHPRRLGAYLVQVAFQGGVISSAMFLTSMAGNPLVAEIAQEMGIHITWTSWAVAAIVPGLAALLILPHFLFWIYPPEITQTDNARSFARSNLDQLGKMHANEWVMVVVFIVLIGLWVSGPFINLNATVAALIGLCFLLLTAVLGWQEIIEEKSAWDTLLWFSALVMMAGYLKTFGLIGWFTHQVVGQISSMHWIPGFLALVLIYFYSHYFFASNIAHIGAMFAPFLALSRVIGTPPEMAALVLGFMSSLFGGITHYGCGPAPIFFGSGYVTIGEWWRLGFYVSVVNLIIWLGIGSFWWRLIGIY